jgi:hypothetical protein
MTLDKNDWDSEQHEFMELVEVLRGSCHGTPPSKLKQLQISIYMLCVDQH